MSKVAITIDIDPDRLGSYTDGFLATAWHVAQANPAPFGDYAACDLVEKLSREIVRRFLRGTEPELWHHQGDHKYSKWLSLFAKYVPPEGVAGTDPAWHDGQWVPNEPDRTREQELLLAAQLVEKQAEAEDSIEVVAFARTVVYALRARAQAAADGLTTGTAD